MSSFALSDWRHSKKIKEKFGISFSSRDQVRVDADQLSLFMFSTIRFFRVYYRNFISKYLIQQFKFDFHFAQNKV